MGQSSCGLCLLGSRLMVILPIVLEQSQQVLAPAHPRLRPQGSRLIWKQIRVYRQDHHLYNRGIIRPAIMTQRYPHNKLFEQILNPANRHNPYPLYAQLRETPISQQEDGTYVVSTYRDIEALLYDPRISSDERKSTR